MLLHIAEYFLKASNLAKHHDKKRARLGASNWYIGIIAKFLCAIMFVS